MLTLKKWSRITDPTTGISVEIGRLSYAEKPQLAAMLAAQFGIIQPLRVESTTAEERTAAVHAYFQAMDHDLVKAMFAVRVRAVQGVETEDGPVTTGPQLLEIADDHIIQWVLTELIRFSSMSVDEGKASRSPSTSSAGASGVSTSGAVPIASADGTTPSTVTEIQPASA